MALAAIIEAAAFARPSLDLPNLVDSRMASVLARYSPLNTDAHVITTASIANMRNWARLRKSSHPPAYPYSMGVCMPCALSLQNALSSSLYERAPFASSPEAIFERIRP